jgi:N-acetylmuramoyl-L-alanine amidase
MTTSSSETSSVKPGVNTLTSFAIVGVVACLFATIFTAWIPTWYLPNAVAIPTYIIPDLTRQPEAGALLPSPTAYPRVGIVSGHWSKDPGYYDPGAICAEALGNVREVDINHAIATRVQQILLQAGYQVDLLEEFDEMLVAYRALALVSIHSDSCEYINDEAKGFKVAAPISNPNPLNSNMLVACMENRYGNETGMALHPGSVTDDMTRYHAFSEIDPNTPAAIIEVGFLNGDNERLRNDQDTLARGVADGILCYLRGESVTQPTSTPAP